MTLAICPPCHACGLEPNQELPATRFVFVSPPAADQVAAINEAMAKDGMIGPDAEILDPLAFCPPCASRIRVPGPDGALHAVMVAEATDYPPITGNPPEAEAYRAHLRACECCRAVAATAASEPDRYDTEEAFADELCAVGRPLFEGLFGAFRAGLPELARDTFGEAH